MAPALRGTCAPLAAIIIINFIVLVLVFVFVLLFALFFALLFSMFLLLVVVVVVLLVLSFAARRSPFAARRLNPARARAAPPASV